MTTRKMLVKDGVAINAVVADDDWQPPEGTVAIWSDTAAIGDSYDGTAFTSSPGEAGPVIPPRLTFNQFMDLFTSTEQAAIASAAMKDVATKLWYDRAVGANFIDMGDARTTSGLQALVDGKLLSAKRRDRVLTGLAPDQ